MSDKTVSREILDALLPEGAIWNPKVGADFDLLLDGMGDNAEVVRIFNEKLAFVRAPQKTPILSDLEKEYGIEPDERLTDQERRDRLEVAKISNDSDGTDTDMQAFLQAAGFDVQVHANSPAADPAIFLDQAFLMVADGDNAYAGFEPVGGPPITSVAGRIGGELLVNGALFTQTPKFIFQAGGDSAFIGNDDAILGLFDIIQLTEVTYDIPTDPGYWGLIYFVGGDATRDGTGLLTSIETAEIPISREQEFKRTILKYRPLHSWAGLIVNYT